MKKLAYLITAVTLSFASCTDANNDAAVVADPGSKGHINHIYETADVPRHSSDENYHGATPGSFTMKVTGSESHITDSHNSDMITHTENGSLLEHNANTENGTLYDNDNGAGVVGTNTSYGNSVGTNGFQSADINESNYQNVSSTPSAY